MCFYFISILATTGTIQVKELRSNKTVIKYVKIFIPMLKINVSTCVLKIDVSSCIFKSCILNVENKHFILCAQNKSKLF